jgi:hypothetical protein
MNLIIEMGVAQTVGHSYELNSKMPKKPKPAQTCPNSTFSFVKKKPAVLYLRDFVLCMFQFFLWATISIILKGIYVP